MSEPSQSLRVRVLAVWHRFAQSVAQRWKSMPAGVRTRWPWMLLALLLGAHMAINSAGWSRTPPPPPTNKQNEVARKLGRPDRR